MKKIVVNGYTYETDCDDVKVGDTAILPTADFLRDVKGPTWEGKVQAIGSDYAGPCRRALSIVGRKPPPKPKPDFVVWYDKLHGVAEALDVTGAWDKEGFLTLCGMSAFPNVHLSADRSSVHSIHNVYNSRHVKSRCKRCFREESDVLAYAEAREAKDREGS